MAKAGEMKMLLEQGMDEEEAKKFLDGREVTTKGLQLPPNQALDLMNKISQFGVFIGPVRFYVVVTEDNEQRLLDLLNSTGKDIAVEGRFDAADIGKDPIGEYNRQVRDGFAGDAAFQGDDGKLAH